MLQVSGDGQKTLQRIFAYFLACSTQEASSSSM